MLGLPRTFWFLWVGALVNRLGGFVYTFLALYLTERRGLTASTAGVVVALYGAGSFASGPVGGYLADHLGRRRTMLASFTLSAAAMLQLGFARSVLHIALSAGVLGFCADLYRPAHSASIADVVAPAERTRAYGYVYWAVNLGFAGAAVIAGFVADRNFTLLFIGDALTTLLFGFVIFFGVPETHPERHLTDRARPDPRVPLRDGVYVLFVITQFLVMLVGAQGNSTLPIDVTRHGVSNRVYGELLAINGVMIVLFQPLAIRLVQRFRRARVLALAALLQGVGFGLTGAGHTARWYGFTIVVWTLAELLYSPVTPTVVADLAPLRLRGTYQGVWMMAWGASASLAPLIGGVILQHLGPTALWGGCFGICLVAALTHLAIGPARRRRLVALGDGVAREDGRVTGDTPTVSTVPRST
jgi:MFS family permease